MTIRGCSTDRPAVWLVRHGQSIWNVSGRIQGQSPAAGGLTEAGRDEAAGAARYLAERLTADRAGSIVASDLPRAAETARIIAGLLGWPLEFSPDLREQRLGALEGRSLAAGPAAAQDAVDALWRDPYRRPPGGESIAEMYVRVHRALHRLAVSRPRTVTIVVTHGGPVRVATAARPPSPGRAMPRVAVGNASVTAWRPGPAGGRSAHTEMVAPWASVAWAVSSSNHMPPSAR
jgi:2,3-bisphosphoglycerate-dependent phosphoglycerate mutase